MTLDVCHCPCNNHSSYNKTALDYVGAIHQLRSGMAAMRRMYWISSRDIRHCSNPVVAAYGTAHELEISGRVPTLEWDVFLDPYLVKRVEIVLNEKEAFIKRQKEAREKASKSNDADENATNEQKDKENESAPTRSTNYSSERLVLKYYDTEIKRRTALLVDRMLIAHGNGLQLIIEQLGYFKKYNFSRVKRTRKTLGGGIFARQWLSVYAEAMRLGLGVDDLDSDEDESIDSETTESLGTQDDTFDEDEKDNVLEDQSESSLGKNVNNKPVGPPTKIYMRRDTADEEDEMSDDGLSTVSEPTPEKTQNRTHKGKRMRQRRKPSRTKAKRNTADAVITSLNQASIVRDRSISDSISLLKQIMQCSAPFGLLLDMKSRHVPRHVWAQVIDFLRDSGARVEGVVRDISQYCRVGVNEIVFFHSAGDLQTSCNKGLLKRGDRVFFNAGSLLWDYPNLYDAVEVKNILCHRLQPCFDGELIKEGYRLKPYARTKSTQTSPKNGDAESETGDESTMFEDEDSTTSDLFARLLVADRVRADSLRRLTTKSDEFMYEEVPDNGECSTIQDYKEHYQLSIGLYVQEFSIDEAAISLIVKYVNSNPHVYDLGLSWGGVNGLTVKGIQPGRFTATEGLWNQRYFGMYWRHDLKPSQSVD
eukprot:scaffold17189_cov67-Cyclotella_meneghiniana.AAC.8